MTRRALAGLMAALALSGCAGMATPSSNDALESPFGKGPLRLGMTKDEVRALWGEPGSIEAGEPDRWGSVRETWIYESQHRLLFDGQNLVSHE